MKGHSCHFSADYGRYGYGRAVEGCEGEGGGGEEGMRHFKSGEEGGLKLMGHEREGLEGSRITVNRNLIGLGNNFIN